MIGTATVHVVCRLHVPQVKVLLGMTEARRRRRARRCTADVLLRQCRGRRERQRRAKKRACERGGHGSGSEFGYEKRQAASRAARPTSARGTTEGFVSLVRRI